MLIERALLPFFPGWACSRLQSRFAFENLRGMYEAAKKTRRTAGWRAKSTSANAEISASLPITRDRSRQLVRDNPYAAAGLDVLVAYQVGTGIIPRSDTGDAALDKQADKLWNEWAGKADLTGATDIYGLQALAARTRSEAGEVLLQMIDLGTADMRRLGTPVPLALSLLEPDYLDTSRIDTLRDGGMIDQGIEFDRMGRRRAYWLFDGHPGDNGALQRITYVSRRVPADNLLHIHRVDRPGQRRGMPDLAPVAMRLRMLDDYEDAALEQARVQACLVAFTTSATAAGRGPLEGPPDAATGQRRRTMAPGMIERLGPGEDVRFNSLPAPAGISEFARHQLRAVAVGYGLTYDLLTGDLTQANYSSLRAGRLGFKRRLEQDQWSMLIPGMCDPVYDRFITAAELVNKLPMREGRWPRKWAPPRFDLLDPGEEIKAMRDAMRNGLMTWGQAVAEQGYDPREQLEEIARWNEELDERGIILDADPRRVSAAGLAQDAKQNAAVEIAATGAAPAPAAA